MSASDPHPTKPADPTGDPLLFAVAGVMAEAPGSVREYVIDGVTMDPGDGLILTEPVSGGMRLLRTNRGLIVETDLHTGIAGECVRCLRPTVTPVRVRIEEEVLPTIDLGSGMPIVLDEGEDPEITRLTDHHELDLRPLLAEAISLAEPLAPVCEEDCPGLCMECGERLVPGHAHGDGPIDPRLEALRAFRVDADDE